MSMNDDGRPAYESRWVEFRLVGQYPKTNDWAVINKKSGEGVGNVAWHNGWRQYVFYPEYETYFNAECQIDIGEFIKLAMVHHNEIAEKRRREE